MQTDWQLDSLISVAGQHSSLVWHQKPSHAGGKPFCSLGEGNVSAVTEIMDLDIEDELGNMLYLDPSTNPLKPKPVHVSVSLSTSCLHCPPVSGS